MKSFGEYFSSLLNMNMFCKDESKSSKDSLDKTEHDKKNSEKRGIKKKRKKEKKKGEETFEFIEISENTDFVDGLCTEILIFLFFLFYAVLFHVSSINHTTYTSQYPTTDRASISLLIAS